jgi:tetratricopeptide (TPR) repeat protein
MQESSQSDMTAAIAETYCEAARAGVNMRAAAIALETIRDALTTETNLFAVWNVFDDQIGRAELDRFMPMLVKLRSQFEGSGIERDIRRLNRVFERNQSKHWPYWVEAYVQSFSDLGWWGTYGRAIANRALPDTPNSDWPAQRIRECTRLILHGRWDEVYDWFLFLAQQELPAHQRARMLLIAATIQLHYFIKPTKARNFLEQAREMAPDEISVVIGWGNYWLQQNNLEEAKRCFEGVVRRMPDLVYGFVGLGDYYDKVGDLSAAEDQYQQAILNAPGMTEGHRRLMNWCGRTHWFRDRQEQLHPLFNRMLVLADNPSSVWADLGIIYKQNGVYDRAREYFEKAISLDSTYANAHAWLGYTYLDEANMPDTDASQTAQRYELARSSFERVIELAPGALDGYWAMAAWYMQRREWPTALEWCNRGLSCHSEWESFVRVRRSDILRELGQLGEAESDLMRSLELEPDNPAALDTLSRLVEAIRTRNAPEAAMRTLETVRGLKGESFEHTFQNLVGNLRYYDRDYASAAEHYRLAIAANPMDNVLYSNLASALEELGTPGKRLQELEEAIAALRRAQELKPEVKTYSERLATLAAERRFVLTYGEDALKFELVVNPIRVEVHNDVLPYVLDATLTNLSKDMQVRIEAMRARVLERFGIRVPAILFGELDERRPVLGNYKITLIEREVVHGNVEPGKKFACAKSVGESAPDAGSSAPRGFWLTDDDDASHSPDYEIWTVADYIINHLQNVLEGQLADFIGYQEVSVLLDNCKFEGCKAIKNSPAELMRFVQVLKSMLQRRVAIVAIDRISDEFVRLRDAGADSGTIADHLYATSVNSPSKYSRHEA